MAEKLTSAQKSAKAKKDKEYYEEHKPPAMKVEELQAKIAEVQQKIAKIKAENPPAKKTGSKRGLDKAGRSPDDPEYGSDPPAKHKTVPVGAGSKHE